MSSPSPGKRRMDTDVVKLYPSWKINKASAEAHSPVFKQVSARFGACSGLLMAAGSRQPPGWRPCQIRAFCPKCSPRNTWLESSP